MNDTTSQSNANGVASTGWFAVLFEFVGGPLDGEKVMAEEWPNDQSLPGTEIVDKNTGSLYRYHKQSSCEHPVYTYRPADSANDQGHGRRNHGSKTENG
jgi:hypothetical protein